MVVGSGNESDILFGVILKTDSNGIELWRAYYSYEGKFTTFGSVVQSPNGSFIVGGQTLKHLPDENEDAIVFAINEFGDELWHGAYGDIGFDDGWAHLANGIDGSYILASSSAVNNLTDISDEYPFISKTNNNGEVQWQHSYGNHYWNTGLTSIKKVSSNGYISAGITTESDIAYEGLLVRIAKNGDSIWMRRYHWIEGNSCYFRDVTPAENGGFVAVGDAYPSSALDLSLDGWVVKTDEYGCVVPGCQLGIEESELIADISIYPNPASRITNIYLKSKDHGLGGELLVRDAMGKLIRQEKTFGGDINIAMDVSDLQAGIYLVEFSCDSQRTVIQKLVVE